MTTINTITLDEIAAEIKADPSIDEQIEWCRQEMAQTEAEYNAYILNGGHDVAVIDDFEWSLIWLRREIREHELELA